jgi:dTDP-4-dehydrorhamnose reductase
MTRILLFGAGGQVGWELQRALAPLGDLVALDRDGAAGLSGDFTQPEALSATVAAVAPAIVVNAAAHTAVDRAESEPDLAAALNAAAPAALARACAARGAWLLHFSTDYVFDGSGHAPRDEDAPTAPLSVYGRTKRDGEDAIRASGCRHLILRTSWVYAARGDNFVRTMLRLAGERDALNVVDDQVGAPTGAELLADVSAHLLRHVRARPEAGGTYHCVPSGEVSWHGYARHVLAAARAAGRPMRVPDGAVRGIPTAEYPTPARRPLNSRLATRKLRDTFGLHLPPWQQGVDRLLAEIL